jgi:hypothetical protein
MPASSARRHRVEAQGLGLSFGTLTRLAQDEESERSGSDQGGRRGLGQKEMAMTEAGKNIIMIFGPKADGTYVIEFKTAARARRWRSRSPGPRRQWSGTSRNVLPYGLFVPDIP